MVKTLFVDIADCLDLNFAEVKQIVDVLLRENLLHIRIIEAYGLRKINNRE